MPKQINIKKLRFTIRLPRINDRGNVQNKRLIKKIESSLVPFIRVKIFFAIIKSKKICFIKLN